MPRPKGWTPRITQELADRMARTKHSDIRRALAAVVEDTAAPWGIRLDAARHLAGAYASLVVNGPLPAAHADIMG